MISKGLYKDAKILLLHGGFGNVPEVEEMNEVIEEYITSMEQEGKVSQCLDSFHLCTFDNKLYAALTFAPVISEE